jgi:hypothetical protein
MTQLEGIMGLPAWVLSRLKERRLEIFESFWNFDSGNFFGRLRGRASARLNRDSPRTPARSYAYDQGSRERATY